MPNQPMLGSHKLMAFVGTTNPGLAKTFYGDTLGLRFLSEDGFAVVFDANGTMLRVAIVKELQPAKYTVLGWEVPDIAGIVQRLQSAGVQFKQYGFKDQDESGIWTAPGGSRIAWFEDPDGNVLSVAELGNPES
jgi:catechol 2,3-dioxygenase-like lactoylglutathione lyase family enzyme